MENNNNNKISFEKTLELAKKSLLSKANVINIYDNKVSIKKRINTLKKNISLIKNINVINNLDVKCSLYIEIMNEIQELIHNRFTQLKSKLENYIAKIENDKLKELFKWYYQDNRNEYLEETWSYNEYTLPLNNFIRELIYNKIFEEVFSNNYQISGLSYQAVKSHIIDLALRTGFKQFEILIAVLEANESELLKLLQVKEEKLKKFTGRKIAKKRLEILNKIKEKYENGIKKNKRYSREQAINYVLEREHELNEIDKERIKYSARKIIKIIK